MSNGSARLPLSDFDRNEYRINPSQINTRWATRAKLFSAIADNRALAALSRRRTARDAFLQIALYHTVLFPPDVAPYYHYFPLRVIYSADNNYTRLIRTLSGKVVCRPTLTVEFLPRRGARKFAGADRTPSLYLQILIEAEFCCIIRGAYIKITRLGYTLVVGAFAFLPSRRSDCLSRSKRQMLDANRRSPCRCTVSRVTDRRLAGKSQPDTRTDPSAGRW